MCIHVFVCVCVYVYMCSYRGGGGVVEKGPTDLQVGELF